MASIGRHLRNLYDINKRYFVSRFRLKKAARRKGDDFYEHLPETVLNDVPCVFVLSTGRCGTMLLARMLQKANNVDAYHTPDPELRYPSRLAYAHGRDRFDEYCTAAKCARYDLIEESAITDRVYAETNCKITFFAPHIRHVFGGSKFVHLVRHPVSFARSAITRGYYQSARADRGHIFPNSEAEKKQWTNMSLAEKVAWNWNETNRYIETFKKELEEERCITVKSTDLFNDLSKTLRLLRYCGAKGVDASDVSSLQRNPVNSTHPFSQKDKILNEEDKEDVLSTARLATKYGFKID